MFHVELALAMSAGGPFTPLQRIEAPFTPFGRVDRLRVLPLSPVWTEGR
jgi:hypothetical protein